MRIAQMGILMQFAILGCVGKPAEPTKSDGIKVSTTHAAAIQDSVRSFAAAVARDVTTGGPEAWLPHFASGSEFFMAAEGSLVFPAFDSATRFLHEYVRSTPKIELAWGSDIRVDPLAPGLAVMATQYRETQTDSAGHRISETGFFTGVVQHNQSGWQLRDAHWSSRPASR
jgi:hypothetical protein